MQPTHNIMKITIVTTSHYYSQNPLLPHPLIAKLLANAEKLQEKERVCHIVNWP